MTSEEPSLPLSPYPESEVVQQASSRRSYIGEIVRLDQTESTNQVAAERRRRTRCARPGSSWSLMPKAPVVVANRAVGPPLQPGRSFVRCSSGQICRSIRFIT